MMLPSLAGKRSAFSDLSAGQRVRSWDSDEKDLRFIKNQI